MIFKEFSVKKENFYKKYIIIITLLIYSLLLVSYLNLSYPMVGHDYTEFMSTLIDTYLHIRNNGFSIQWFTPSFGGGVPAFFNPQNIQYSIPQFLMLFVNPWVSIKLSLLLYSFIGYWAFYRLGRDILNFGWKSSCLGATLFIVNGFYIEHAAAGHVGYQVFPLISVIIFFLLSPTSRPVFGGVVIGLCIALLLFSSGFFILIIFAFTIFLTIPLVLIFYPGKINIKNTLRTGIVGSVIGLSLSAGKLYAVYSFMRFFPRIVNHQYYYNFTDSILGFLGQILGVMFFVPFAILRKGDANQALVYLRYFISGAHGIWEKDISISPVILILCTLGVLWVLMNLQNVFGESQWRKQQGIGIISLLLFIWITFEVISTRGNIYDFFHKLPVLSSLHVNYRFTAAYILPSAIFGVYAFDKITSSLTSKIRLTWFIVLNFLALTLILTYFSLSPDIQNRATNVEVAIKTYQLARAGENFNIDNILMTMDEIKIFMENASNLIPLEPIFGYGLDSYYFPTKLKEGSVYLVTDGYLNFTNPIGFVYPEESGVMAFERFRVEDQEILRDFLARKQLNWSIPTIQKTLNYFTLIIFISALFFLGYQGIPILLVNIRSFKDDILWKY
jgi:hypothetical protein